MKRMTKVILGAVTAAIAVGLALFVLGLPRSGAEVKPTTPTTTVDQGQIGSVNVEPSGGQPATGHVAP